MAIFNNQKNNHLEIDTVKEFEKFQKRYEYDSVNDEIGKDKYNKNKGGQSKVFRVRDNIHDEVLVLKISDVSTDKNGKVISLKNEFDLIKDLEDHPNIAKYIKVYTFKDASRGNVDYCIMKYYPDGDLGDLINKNLLNDSQKESIALQILEGLKYLHQNDIKHRDLKPQNILISKSTNSNVLKIVPKITDFGLSKKGESTIPSVIIKSLGYTSPEQNNENVKIQNNTDLWAYGAIIFELFTSQMLFDGGYDNEVQNQMNDINFITNKLNKVKDSNWKKAIEKCLIYNPEERVKTADELFQIINSSDTNEEPEIRTYDHGRENEKGKMIVIAPVGINYEYSIDNINFTKNPVFENLNIGKYSLTIKNQSGLIIQKEFSIGNGGSLVDSVEKPKKSFFPKINFSSYKKQITIGITTVASIAIIAITFPIIKDFIKPNQNKIEKQEWFNNYNTEKVKIDQAYNDKNYKTTIDLSTNLLKIVPNTATKEKQYLYTIIAKSKNGLEKQTENVIPQVELNDWKVAYEKSITAIKVASQKDNYLQVIEIAEKQLLQTPKTATKEINILKSYIKSSNNEIESEKIEWEEYFKQKSKIVTEEAKKGNWEKSLLILNDLLDRIPAYDIKNKNDIIKAIEGTKKIIDRKKEWKPYEMYPIGNNMILVKKDGFYGTVDKINYKTVIGLEYKFIVITPNSNDKILTGTNKDGNMKFDYNGNKL